MMRKGAQKSMHHIFDRPSLPVLPPHTPPRMFKACSVVTPSFPTSLIPRLRRSAHASFDSRYFQEGGGAQSPGGETT